MKTLIASVGLGLAMAPLFAASTITGVPTISRPANSRRVTISYVLAGDPAIVTVDIQTNFVAGGETEWVSIGGENYANMVGDVNHLVQPGERTVQWNPVKSWPNQKVAAGGLRAVVKAYPSDSPPDYLVIDLETGAKTWYENVESLPDGGLKNDVYRTERLVMRRIPAAGVIWTMGDDPNATYAPSTAATPHKVVFSSDYYMAVFELTYGQLVNVTGQDYDTLQAFKNEQFKFVRPATNVRFPHLRGSENGYCWPTNVPGMLPHDVDSGFSKKGTILRQFRDLCGLRLDLPTEAQWEYACRAGAKTRLYNGGTVSSAGDVSLHPLARFRYNGGYVGGSSEPDYENCSTNFGTAVVGSYEPNAWGLYDMLGNVREWCLDWSGPSSGLMDYVFEVGVPRCDPPGEVWDSTAVRRVVRGGGYSSSSYNCTCGYREHAIPAAGSPGVVAGCRFCWTINERTKWP